MEVINDAHNTALGARASRPQGRIMGDFVALRCGRDARAPRNRQPMLTFTSLGAGLKPCKQPTRKAQSGDWRSRGDPTGAEPREWRKAQMWPISKAPDAPAWSLHVKRRATPQMGRSCVFWTNPLTSGLRTRRISHSTAAGPTNFSRRYVPGCSASQCVNYPPNANSLQLHPNG